jgi:3-polyprenyl-4-hydroxybenzoate decarboxylase
MRSWEIQAELVKQASMSATSALINVQAESCVGIFHHSKWALTSIASVCVQANGGWVARCSIDSLGGVINVFSLNKSFITSLFLF